MTATATTPGTTTQPMTGHDAGGLAREPEQHSRLPMTTLVGVELRKMFDTRSGFWLMTSIGVLAVLATAAVILWAPDEELTYATFAAAIGIPMSIVLPVIAILAVTSEWSQRSGLTTFTLVPHRGRVLTAKAISAVGVGVVSMFVAMAIGAVGNVLGSTLAGVDTTWDAGVADLAFIILASVLGMLVGYMLGVLLRSSPGAIVGYFVYAFVLPTLAGFLAASQEWFRDAQPWVDFQLNQTGLYDASSLTAEGWAQLAVTGGAWLALPLVVGVWLTLRSEVT